MRCYLTTSHLSLLIRTATTLEGNPNSYTNFLFLSSQIITEKCIKDTHIIHSTQPAEPSRPLYHYRFCLETLALDLPLSALPGSSCPTCLHMPLLQCAQTLKTRSQKTTQIIRKQTHRSQDNQTFVALPITPLSANGSTL